MGSVSHACLMRDTSVSHTHLSYLFGRDTLSTANGPSGVSPPLKGRLANTPERPVPLNPRGRFHLN
jgi:hypothetical protein